MPPDSSSEFTVGQTFSHYRLTGKLGEGGMGVVFAAEDLHLGRQVAIKVLNSKRTAPSSRTRFLREARAASKLNHPNVTAVYDYGETEGGQPFIVMELLSGKNFSDLLRARSLTLEQSMALIRRVLSALVEAHRHGIVHRDIKPSNIVVGENGSVKVLDFGLAKSLQVESTSSADAGLPELTTQTLNGTVVGTPLYVSPEQATGATVDQRSDIFSVGAVLYECIVGRPAFAAPSVVEIFAKVISPVAPPLPSTFNPAIPPELDHITLKALAKTPEARYQSAEEFLEDLRRVPALNAGAESVSPLPVYSHDSWYRITISRGAELRRSLQKLHLSRSIISGIVARGQSRIFKISFPAVMLLLFITLQTYRPLDPIDSVAVLPFISEGQDASLDYLDERMTDSLISSLSRMQNLKVISRASVIQYKGQEVVPAAVGSKLNVRTVLVGKVKQVGDEIQIAVELIDTRDGRRLWNGQYTRQSSDALSVQEDIAQRVVESLHGRAAPGGEQAATRRQPKDPAAASLYEKGRWHWNKRTTEDYKQAIICFEQAISLDPDFALAHAGLADAYVINGWFEPRESYLRAKAAAARALELDDTLGEAHATLGFIKTHYERDWDNGESEFKRAIELSPNYATARHWYADHLLARGRFDQALPEFKRAQELDPLSPIINTEVGLCYFYKRQYALAIRHFQMMSDLFPNSFPPHYYLGWAYTQNGQYPEAIEHYQKALALSKRHSMVVAMLGYTYAVSGREAEAREMLNELQIAASRKYVSPFRFAILYTGLGDKEAAFQWLNKAYDDLDLLFIHVNVSPFFDSLRGDTRFGELLQRLGLPS